MSKPLVSDKLWAIIAPLLPPERPKPKGGRPRIPDRAVLSGILFVLKSGILWEMLPQELGCGSGMTCWRRLRDWQQAGVWQRVHQVILQRLQDAGRIDWERASLDSASVPAPGGASKLTGIQRIAASEGPSAMWLWIERDCHWRRSSRRRTCMTRSYWRRRSMRFRHCGCRVDAVDGLASAQ